VSWARQCWSACRFGGVVLTRLALVFGCGTSQQTLPVAAEPVAPPPGGATPSLQSSPVNSVQRSDIQLQYERGLGDFLSRIELEPSLEGGKFQGFRVVALTDPELWAGVDLKPGDVVKNVNGADLEQPDTVFNAFVGLRQAREIQVELVREGAPRWLRLPIIGEPLKALPVENRARGRATPAGPTPEPAPSKAAAGDPAAALTPQSGAKRAGTKPAVPARP
jgi:hypothetical protein